MSVETGLRIKKIREYRNYTQQHLADSLNISQNAYSKIESGITKLTTDRLEEISTILDVPVETILSSEKQIFNMENNRIDKFYGYIENLYEENKEMQQKQMLINEKLILTLESLLDKINKK